MTAIPAEQAHQDPAGRERRRALGQQLRDARIAAKLSQRELAHKVGYTRSAVSSAESGGYASRGFYECCDKVLNTGGTLAVRYDAIAAERAKGLQASQEFGEPAMKVVVGYARGAWHIEVHLPERT
jgi:transcriptional regulator with XRE-family HTH domain